MIDTVYTGYSIQPARAADEITQSQAVQDLTKEAVNFQALLSEKLNKKSTPSSTDITQSTETDGNNGNVILFTVDNNTAERLSALIQSEEGGADVTAILKKLLELIKKMADEAEGGIDYRAAMLMLAETLAANVKVSEFSEPADSGDIKAVMEAAQNNRVSVQINENGTNTSQADNQKETETNVQATDGMEEINNTSGLEAQANLTVVSDNPNITTSVEEPNDYAKNITVKGAKQDNASLTDQNTEYTAGNGYIETNPTHGNGTDLNNSYDSLYQTVQIPAKNTPEQNATLPQDMVSETTGKNDGINIFTEKNTAAENQKVNTDSEIHELFQTVSDTGNNVKSDAKVDEAAKRLFNELMNIARERSALTKEPDTFVYISPSEFAAVKNAAGYNRNLNNLKNVPDELSQILDAVKSVKAEKNGDNAEEGETKQVFIPRFTQENIQFEKNFNPVKDEQLKGAFKPADSQLADVIGAKMKNLGNGETEFEMILNPESLGKITVKLITEHGKVNVTVTAEKQETSAFLQSRVENLSQTLKDNGVELQKYAVYHEGESQQSDFNEREGGQKRRQEHEQGENKNGEEENGLSFSELIEAL